MIAADGKWALVTGASRGIGYLTARFMAERGCNLVLHNRSLEHTKSIAEEVQTLGVRANGVQAELANHQEVVGMLDQDRSQGNSPEQAGYSASKAALDKFSKDLGSKLDGTDVLINLVDPGWCRTDMGGPHAPNPPESSLPGVVLGGFVDDKRSGRIFRAQDFAGMSLEDAVGKAETRQTPSERYP